MFKSINMGGNQAENFPPQSEGEGGGADKDILTQKDKSESLTGYKTAPKPEPEGGDDLGTLEKIGAGALFIGLTVLALVQIISNWPDRLPQPKEGLKPLYIWESWNVHLAYIKDTCCRIDSVTAAAVKDQSARGAETTKPADTLTSRDSLAKAGGPGSVAANGDTTKRSDTVKNPCKIPGVRLIDLNLLTLILVAYGGFLGNMIHIATSFTNFVGSGTFKRRWYLWYFVKPFTAAALATGLYFVFRAGFLNYSADPAGINLYGVMTVAILAGLFTDRATLKLGEVFDVVFSVKKDGKSGDMRTDPMIPPHYRFDKPPTPDKLLRTAVNAIVITGDDLDKGRLNFLMGGVPLPDNAITRTVTKITIQYRPPADLGTKKVMLSIKDDRDKELYNFEFEVTP